MKIVAQNISILSGDPVLQVEHAGETLDYNVSYYGRNSFNVGFDLFEQLNAYWAQLYPEQQAKIFECYRQMKTSLESPFATHASLVSELSVQANILFELHNFEDFKHWIFHKSNIKIPDSFEERFIYDVDKQNTPEQTYLKHEYIDLVTMTLIFRTMMPAWGEFISMMRKEHGNFLKEFHAYQTIRSANIQQHHAFVKLSNYVDRTIGPDRYNIVAIIDEGLSSEDFQEWVLARVVVRRLCVSDVRGNEPKANVVTFIHKYVAQSARPNQMSLEDRIEDKNRDIRRGEGDDVDDKLSAIERYRIKHDISMGELEEIEFAIKSPHNTAYKLSSKMTDEILATSMETSKQLYGNRVMDAQIMLLQWTFKPVVSPKGIPYLDYGKIVENLGVLEAVLWARGHHYLALLASSYTRFDNRIMQVSSVDSVKRLPVEMIEELRKCYPYQRMAGGKKTGYKPVSLAVDAIEQLYSALSMHAWIPTASDERIQQVLGTVTRRIPIPPDIRILIAKFVLEIGQRSWT